MDYLAVRFSSSADFVSSNLDRFISFIPVSVAKNVRMRGSKVQSLVDEVQEC